jgi:hypothetical protein
MLAVREYGCASRRNLGPLATLRIRFIGAFQGEPAKLSFETTAKPLRRRFCSVL